MIDNDLFIMTDNLHRIGSSKDTCEDYSYSSYEGFIALGDGTSNSSFTDVGARLLVNKKIDFIRKNIYEEDTLVLNETLKIVDILGLSKYSLASTLNYVYVKNDLYQVGLLGDGVVVCRRSVDKVLEVWNFNFSEDSPYYLIYELDARDKKSWLDKFDPKLIRELNLIYPDGIIDPDTYVEVTDITDGFRGIEYNTSLKEYDLVVLLSDGIHSFKDSHNQEISYLNVIHEMFKNIDFTDDFINRSYSRYLSKYKSYRHHEDLSIAGIHASF
jgi:sulfur transfer complex TusBCD TusB component (DsrH family)